MSEYKKELEELIEIVINEGGSDLHISVGRHPSIRVLGTLVPLVKKPILTPEDTLGLVEVLFPTKEKRDEFFAKKELDFSYSYKEKARFRCNAFFASGSAGVAMRLIPKKISTLEELNLPPSLADFTRRQQGFFLLVGPVGQGKTTTLSAMIELINQERAEHIITIEDPIEYIYEQKQSIIDQREIGLDSPDFHTALRGTFRQDVDVIMVGEMREPETIATAVTAAETGHLVFATLHTNNAPQTIDRILDSFSADQQPQIRAQLSNTLSGIFSQRLLPRVSGGVVPAYELLINNNAVANLIREGRTHEIDSVIQTSMEQGMIDLNRCLADLVQKGEITIETARMYSLKPQVLDRLI
ncbi:type IV pili twitching motility protein PilT [Candidatus Campbellbacteria bacterium CG22_combo_CG10-13_8_21_14_all_36_13]|uniref:Type IV pili twitching motility protein PilT n=1 Tax=Candidatus Campbellbacteria bacterium CG22_combo_CG10-13_8_21_14_all_36_13 TaxID=1974529 RepID=A0A2H0DXT6_9BACT|nr:MAG: type IV pili twitching motility protein PilT [Candidatus Campbellbacteria bacterium CG22_combo_CG10-13_8_21_14_all_36_13]